jgi:hypothetical protein
VGTGLLLALVAASRIVISEVMADPKGVTGVHMPEDRNEFIELYNASDSAVDLLDWTIDDGDALDHVQAWTDSSIRGAESLRLNTTWLDPHGYAIVLDSEYTDTAALGGYLQPYRFPAGTLVLTVRNTTIGDGLAGTDPLFLSSPAAETSTFGTPSNTMDSIPCDAGDGISWERIDVLGSDTVSNWMVCRDTAGCTPGTANSSTTFLDVVVTDIALAESSLMKPGSPLSAAISIADSGFRDADVWSLSVFLDGNGNGTPDAGEHDTSIVGPLLRKGEDTTLVVGLTCPNAKTDLWAKLTCDGDCDSTNNSRRLTIMPGGSERLFDLSLSSFSPDGDGVEDSLAVLYHLPEAKGTLKMMVFDLGGRQVATLFSGKPPDARGVVCWNGLSSSGTRAPTGIYAICVDYRYSGASRAEKLPVVLLRK